MKIDGVSPVSATAVQKALQQVQLKSKTVEEPESDAPEETPPAQTQEGEPGVIRLLMEGHFKGVADVRLRINFAEEIAAIENSRLQSAAASGMETFSQSLDPAFQGLIDSGLLNDEQLAAVGDFQQFIQNPVDENGGAIDASGLLEALQGHFDGLMAQFAPPAEETGQPEGEPDEEFALASEEELFEPVASGEPETERIELQTEPPVNPLAEMLDTLTQTFQAAMESLRSQLDTPGVLPEISEPTGNGRAYEKFLAIYESMNSPTAETETESAEAAPPEGISYTV